MLCTVDNQWLFTMFETIPSDKKEKYQKYKLEFHQ